MYTTDELITLVKLYAAVPNSQPAFTDSQLITVINNEMYSVVVPMIMRLKEDFFIDYTDYSITTSNQVFRLPANEMGNVLKEVKIIRGDEFINIPRIDLSAKAMHCSGFYMEGNIINIIGSENYSGYDLRLYYFRRPNRLLITTDYIHGAKAITAIDTGTNTISVSSLPSSWSANTKIDIIQGAPPFDILAENQSITLGTNSIVLSSLPSGLAIGDWVAFTGYSPVPMIPAEAHNLLAQAVVIKILESLGDDKVKSAIEKYKQLEDYLKTLLTPRVEQESQKIVNYYGFL